MGTIITTNVVGPLS